MHYSASFPVPLEKSDSSRRAWGAALIAHWQQAHGDDAREAAVWAAPVAARRTAQWTGGSSLRQCYSMTPQVPFCRLHYTLGARNRAERGWFGKLRSNLRIQQRSHAYKKKNINRLPQDNIWFETYLMCSSQYSRCSWMW